MSKKFMKNRMLIISIFISLIIFAIISIFILNIVKNNKKKTLVIASSSEAQKINKATYIGIDTPLFPAVDIEVPSKEPIPEYFRGGERHWLIAQIQEKLMELNFMDDDEPTDFYGPVTQSAIKIFQRQIKRQKPEIAQDGIIGPATLKELLSDDAPTYLAQIGDVGEDIRAIQKRLYALGYLAREAQIDGNFNQETEDAIKHFQESNDLAVDGKVGKQTTEKLYSENVKANISAFGEKSEIVKVAQERLMELGYLTSIPDGSYGTDTVEAIKRFQSKHDIVEDGYLGPETRSKLMSNEAQSNSLDIGDSGFQVRNIQEKLKQLKYLRNIDDYYGENTKNAIQDFQRRNGLSVDGKAGPNTLAKLNDPNAKKALAPSRRSQNNNSILAGKNNKNKKGVNNRPIQAADSASVNSLLSVASSKLGKPYIWGAKGPNAFDCSGFVYWCLNHAGVSQSYITSYGWRTVGKYTRISNFSDIRAGDIVVVRGHVGIATGGGGVIDASSSNGHVVSRSLGGWWQRNFIVAWRIF